MVFYYIFSVICLKYNLDQTGFYTHHLFRLRLTFYCHALLTFLNLIFVSLVI